MPQHNFLTYLAKGMKADLRRKSSLDVSVHKVAPNSEALIPAAVSNRIKNRYHSALMNSSRSFGVTRFFTWNKQVYILCDTGIVKQAERNTTVYWLLKAVVISWRQKPYLCVSGCKIRFFKLWMCNKLSSLLPGPLMTPATIYCCSTSQQHQRPQGSLAFLGHVRFPWQLLYVSPPLLRPSDVLLGSGRRSKLSPSNSTG